MGFLSFFKKNNTNNNNDNEETLYKTLLIKKLIDDIEDLKRKYNILEQELKEIKLKKTEVKQQDKPKTNKLSKLETKIYNAHNEHKVKTIDDLSLILNIKIECLRVYISRIRSKGFIIEFNN